MRRTVIAQFCLQCPFSVQKFTVLNTVFEFTMVNTVFEFTILNTVLGFAVGT